MIAVAIPCYRVKDKIADVINAIGQEVDKIYVVDDQCPEKSGEYVQSHVNDPRVKVIFHEKNLGVGGAVKTGFKHAYADGAKIMVKLDGDGQMDPSLIPLFIKPIQNKRADYTKGNRFFFLSSLKKMPTVRLFGNSALSLINKVVNGYWPIMDPTNGYLAIHRSALELMDLDKVENRYFFESDMLFRLGLVRAVVQDINMHAVYEDENSSLSVTKVLFEFPPKYIKRFVKRITYTYFLRDFNFATLELIVGTFLLFGGAIYGAISWAQGIRTAELTSTGTVMLAVLPIILGFQLLLSAINFDMKNTPKSPLCQN